MKLSEIVSRFRTENNLSIDEFAAKCGLSKGYISMIEREINPRNKKPISPTIDTVRKLAGGMSMKCDDLISMLDNDTAMNLLKQKMDDYKVIDDRILLQAGGYEERLLIEKLATAYILADPNTQKIVRMLLKIDGGES